MDSGLFGEGSIRLDWTGVDGLPGLAPQLILNGTLVANGYGVGAVVQITAEVTAWNISDTYAFLGTTGPKAYALNQLHPPPTDETHWDVRLKLPMSPSAIEGLEERRQGKNFSLQIETALLLVNGGEPTGARTKAHYATHPTRTSQDQLHVKQADWAMVLERWGRGVGILVLVPLTALEPSEERAEVIRHLRDARQKIDGADYQGSLTDSRKALELLRALSPVTLQIPINQKDRDPIQRIHAVIEALFGLASATLHTDPPVNNFVPMRADAVSVAAGTASVAQQVFAWLDKP